MSPPARWPLAFGWVVPCMATREIPSGFVPVTEGVEIMDSGVSKLNEAEAATACDAVQALSEDGQ